MSAPTFSPSWSADQSDEGSCKLAGEFFATWMTTPEQIAAKTYRGPGMEVAYEYLKILSNSGESASKGELVHWFADEQDKAWMGSDEDRQEFNNAFIQPALDYCGASVCKSLGWTGNNDLAGIGVFISYYVQAALVTIFCLVMLVCRKRLEGLRHDGLPNGPLSFSDRVLNAFDKGLSALLQGVYLFCVVVIFASLNSILVARNEPNAVTSYETITATLVSIFTICPVILMCKTSKEAKPLQLAISLVLWIVMLAIVNLGRDRDPNETAMEADTFGHPFEIYCPVLGNGYHEAIRIIVDGASAIIFVVLIILGFFKYKYNGTEAGSPPRFVKILSFGLSFFVWLAMWAFLAGFTIIRARTIEVAGESDKSNEWSFGQIVAVATWAAVILQFFYALAIGSNDFTKQRNPPPTVQETTHTKGEMSRCQNIRVLMAGG